EKISLQHLLKEAHQEVQDLLQERHILTEWKLPKTALLVNADPTKLRQAFVNVFKNAARFSSAGGKVAVNLRQVGSQAEIAITDHGIGIPASQLETIFDRMRQLEDHTIRTHGGLGLGLPIARGLVELHHGRMWAESEGEHKGTTVRCTLPLASVPPFVEDSI
ncbi:MAG: ATP-binding protein, partial [Anaerolineales bacterium]